MRRLTRLVLAAGLALGGGAAVTPPAQAAACSSTSGVTVVVTFPGGSTVTRCAPGDPGSGLAALSGAGFSTTQVQRFPGAVCRIDAQPASDPCVNMPPSSAYWSYWHASRGGSWSYSSLGGGSYDPKPGSVEGWSFGSGTAPAVAPPPPVTQPKPSPRPPTTSPKPRASSTTPAPRVSTKSAAPRQSASSGTGNPAGKAGVVVSTRGTATTTPALSSSASTTAPGVASTAASSTSAATGAPATGTGTDLAGERTAAPASTPWSLVAGLLAIAALGVTAFAARRRRATH